MSTEVLETVRKSWGRGRSAGLFISRLFRFNLHAMNPSVLATSVTETHDSFDLELIQALDDVIKNLSNKNELFLAFKHLCTLFDFNKLSLKDVEDISAATLLTIEQVMADEFMLKLNLMRNVVRNKFDESDLFFVKKTMEGDWIKYARNKKKILEIDMRCSNCGSDTNAYGKRCLVCGLILEKAKQEGGAKESKKKRKI